MGKDKKEQAKADGNYDYMFEGIDKYEPTKKLSKEMKVIKPEKSECYGEREDYLMELIDGIKNEDIKTSLCLFIEGYDIKTISFLLDRKENTIKSDLRKAREELEAIANG